MKLCDRETSFSPGSQKDFLEKVTFELRSKNEEVLMW